MGLPHAAPSKELPQHTLEFGLMEGGSLCTMGLPHTASSKELPQHTLELGWIEEHSPWTTRATLAWREGPVVEHSQRAKAEAEPLVLVRCFAWVVGPRSLLATHSTRSQYLMKSLQMVELLMERPCTVGSLVAMGRPHTTLSKELPPHTLDLGSMGKHPAWTLRTTLAWREEPVLECLILQALVLVRRFAWLAAAVDLVGSLVAMGRPHTTLSKELPPHTLDLGSMGKHPAW
jgi:hypothetical protein